jgi:N-acetyl-anhydromuramoyl-L-alanine amidase
LSRRYRIAEVVGHEHVAPGRKADPGPGFDWPRLAHACAGAGPHRPLIGVQEA